MAGEMKDPAVIAGGQFKQGASGGDDIQGRADFAFQAADPASLFESINHAREKRIAGTQDGQANYEGQPCYYPMAQAAHDLLRFHFSGGVEIHRPGRIVFLIGSILAIKNGIGGAENKARFGFGRQFG